MQFKEVNYWNCDEIIDLKVKQFQKKFVASNMYSLAEVYGAVASKGNAVPFGIYLGDKPIGFIMFGYYPDEEYARKVFKECYLDFIPRSYLIWRFMIDKRYQGKGYEKKAKENGANTVVIEQVYDWNVDFFVKAGYKITGAMKDFPKGHSYYALQKFL